MSEPAVLILDSAQLQKRLKNALRNERFSPIANATANERWGVAGLGRRGWRTGPGPSSTSPAGSPATSASPSATSSVSSAPSTTTGPPLTQPQDTHQPEPRGDCRQCGRVEGREAEGLFPSGFVSRLALPEVVGPGEAVLAAVDDFPASAPGDLALYKGTHPSRRFVSPSSSGSRHDCPWSAARG